ncbi:MAG: hypothetical protein RL508_132 [Actinomycetota bacterium]|jgi:DNA-binding LacI/PurR family transcriptional regulator
MSQKNANMYDVAKLAGVSHQTVSRVINGSASIKPETRDKVLAAIEELGYRPSMAARALATSKSRMLGVLVSDSAFFGPSSMTHAMEAEARAAGYFVVAVAVDAQDGAAVLDAIEHLKKLGVDGMIIIAPQESILETYRPVLLGMPLITIDATESTDASSVSIDNIAGARLAVAHLAELGHTKIAHVSGPNTWYEAKARARGYELELSSRGLQRLPILEGDWSARSGFEAGLKLIADYPEVTAVFAANDQTALGLLTAFAQNGIDVPAQVSIVGFDNQDETEFYNPALTTVAQDFAGLGKHAMKLLLDAVSGTSLATHEDVVPKLVVRASTASPNK